LIPLAKERVLLSQFFFQAPHALLVIKSSIFPGVHSGPVLFHPLPVPLPIKILLFPNILHPIQGSQIQVLLMLELP
jgi:hypothetical protein